MKLPNAYPKSRQVGRKSVKRSRTPLRKTRLRKYNAKRKGHAFPKNVDRDRRDWMHEQACVATGKRTGQWIHYDPTWMPRTWSRLAPWRCYVVCAHLKSRGSGGKDVANMMPLDSRVHDWQGAIGWPEFEHRVGLIPREEIAQNYDAAYRTERGIPVSNPGGAHQP